MGPQLLMVNRCLGLPQGIQAVVPKIHEILIGWNGDDRGEYPFDRAVFRDMGVNRSNLSSEKLLALILQCNVEVIFEILDLKNATTQLLGR